MSARIAVIIPCYDSAETLPALIGALKAQTRADFVALFVDDGSTDGSVAIVQRAAEGDARFVSLAGPHEGPGPGRNVGLDRADELGVDYVTFVDSDDLPAATMLEAAVAALDAAGADIVHYQWSSEPGGEPHRDSVGVPAIYVWNKLYRRQAIAGIRFVRSKFAEDLAFFLETEARRPKRTAITKPLYVHFTRAGSLWESRTPADVAAAMRTVITQLEMALAAAPPALRRDWACFYRVKLLRNWKRSLRKILREKRDKAVADYLAVVATLHFPFFGAWRFRLSHMAFAVGTALRRMLKNRFERRAMNRLRRRYESVRRRLADRAATDRLHVVFQVSDVSKWKCQRVYETMAAGERYAPVLLVDLSTDELLLPAQRRAEIYAARRRYFVARGLEVADGYDAKAGKVLPIARLAPDIVFFGQPWKLSQDRDPSVVSAYALTCYVPYYVVNYGMPEIDCKLDFIHRVWTFFVQSDDYARLYESVLAGLPRADRIVGVGHPMLDLISDHRTSRATRPTVIYAPHWTLDTGRSNTLLSIGTFMSNGRAILAYAQAHPEIDWIFKPHPLLAATLMSTGGWSEQEVRAYWSEWERLGTACYDGDYLDLFARSTTLVTDCGSFLSEYAVTGGAIIRLVRREGQTLPSGPVARLYETYYRADGPEQMRRLLDQVALAGEDPARETRLGVARELGLLESRASERIVDYLDQEIGR